ncbi:MAG: hypothetical protein N2039_10385 [Gemmataceae bacterium]|nr:hypothetical protein [Gemmataceae bacterium]
MSLVCVLAAVISLVPPSSGYGYVHDPAFVLDKVIRGASRPYLPQPGDLLLFSDDRIGWTIAHNLAKTGKPHHSAIVFRLPDGTLATAQAGSHRDTPSKVGIMLLDEHLEHEAGRTGRRTREIWVRQRKTPLTPEQSEALTRFAFEAEGRRFARIRMFFLMTPWRAKGPLRTAVVGKTDLDQKSYFCSEFIVTALAACGAIDIDLARPAATFPRDLFFGTSRNHWVARGLCPLNRDWEAPARWTACPQRIDLPKETTTGIE